MGVNASRGSSAYTSRVISAARSCRYRLIHMRSLGSTYDYIVVVVCVWPFEDENGGTLDAAGTREMVASTSV